MINQTSFEDSTRLWPAPGQADSADFALGDLIDDRFAVRGVIGQGGMGQVLRVESRADRRIYALKYCRLSGEERKRFSREVRLMGKVRHRHVVPVLDANLRHEPPYFVMPLAECSLEAELARARGDEPRALAIFRQIGLGVRALHDSGIVHRDLKPANVLRFEGNRFVVADLGLAKCASGDTTGLTRTRTVLGTFAFLAPEQLLPAGSRRADARTDIFQLGKVLYQLLTRLSPALIDPTMLPGGLSHIIERATSPNPNGRYRSLGEFLDALRYYELAKDPARHAREAVENLVLQAEALLKRRERPSAIIPELLALLARPGTTRPGAVLASFERIPDRLLPFIAQDYGAEFLPILEEFARALQAKAARCDFAYADIVARRMRSVFRHARHDTLKCVALQAMLIASVALNRFAAITVFNRLLIGVKGCDLGLSVAEMLSEHADYYRQVASGVPPGRLHPAIRALRQKLLSPQEDALTNIRCVVPIGDYDHAGFSDFAENGKVSGPRGPNDPQNRRSRVRRRAVGAGPVRTW